MGVKWNQDAKPAEKLLAMYSMLLFSGKAASLSELSRELDCSKQAVNRLLDQMEAAHFGKLHREKRGREAVYSLERPQKLPQISLDAEGLQQLALCRDFLLHLLPPSVRKNINTTLQQASAYLPPECGMKENGLSGAALTKGSIDYAPFQTQLRTVTKAISQQRVCAVEYRSAASSDFKTHFFAPQRLLAYHEVLYVQGWIVTDSGKAEIMHEKCAMLALQRTGKVLLTRRSSAHLPSIKAELKPEFGVMEQESFAVKIFFTAAVAKYVAERQWSPDQQFTRGKDGSLMLDMTARSEAEVLAWVLSFGPEAEIIEPDSLREKVIRKIKEMAKNYE